MCFQISSSSQLQENSGGIFTKFSCEKFPDKKRIQAWVKKFELYGTVENLNKKSDRRKSHSERKKVSQHGLRCSQEESLEPFLLKKMGLRRPSTLSVTSGYWRGSTQSSRPTIQVI